MLDKKDNTLLRHMIMRETREGNLSIQEAFRLMDEIDAVTDESGQSVQSAHKSS